MNLNPYRWSASLLTDLMDCPKRLEFRTKGIRVPEIPIFVAGQALHEAARFAVLHGSFCRSVKSPAFFASEQTFFKWWWGFWTRFVKEKEKKSSIRWHDRDKEFSSLGAYCARLLTGLAWTGPEGQRKLELVQKGYYQMLTNPPIPFEILAAEKHFKVLFDQFTLVGKIDQIWRVKSCAQFEGGEIVIVDLTMGAEPRKRVQLTLYSLALRLAVRQDFKFREQLFGIPRNRRLGSEELELLREEAVTVLSLSQAKLKVYRGPHDYAWLKNLLEEAAVCVLKSRFEAKPTDSVCPRCEFNQICEFAAVKELIDFETGGAEVISSVNEEQIPGRQTAFPGWLRGSEVTQAVVRRPVVEVPRI